MMLCCVCQEQRDPPCGVIDNARANFLVCADCVERLADRKLLPGRATADVLRCAIDCFAQKAVQTLGLAHVEAALEKGTAQALIVGLRYPGNSAQSMVDR